MADTAIDTARSGSQILSRTLCARLIPVGNLWNPSQRMNACRLPGPGHWLPTGVRGTRSALLTGATIVLVATRGVSAAEPPVTVEFSRPLRAIVTSTCRLRWWHGDRRMTRSGMRRRAPPMECTTCALRWKHPRWSGPTTPGDSLTSTGRTLNEPITCWGDGRVAVGRSSHYPCCSRVGRGRRFKTTWPRRSFSTREVGETVQLRSTPEARAAAESSARTQLAEPLTADGAVQIALDYSPTFQRMLADSVAASAAATQSARLPNPTLTSATCPRATSRRSTGR